MFLQMLQSDCYLMFFGYISAYVRSMLRCICTNQTLLAPSLLHSIVISYIANLGKYSGFRFTASGKNPGFNAAGYNSTVCVCVCVYRIENISDSG